MRFFLVKIKTKLKRIAKNIILRYEAIFYSLEKISHGKFAIDRVGVISDIIHMENRDMERRIKSSIFSKILQFPPYNVKLKISVLYPGLDWPDLSALNISNILSILVKIE